MSWIGDNELPNLGLATTRELLQEIKARGETGLMNSMSTWAGNLLEVLPDYVLDYKTVGD